jgi:hypothetical protein
MTKILARALTTSYILAPQYFLLFKQLKICKSQIDTCSTTVYLLSDTTAQVSFILIGEDNETEPRVLMDERRKVLQKGDTDTFVLAVPAPLGNLSTLRIWHDDSGKSPGWFFFQMQVTDLQTKEKTLFICQRWLARNEDDCLVCGELTDGMS